MSSNNATKQAKDFGCFHRQDIKYGIREEECYG